jgi:hypothetical protein
MVQQHRRCLQRPTISGWILVLTALCCIYDACDALSIRTAAKSCMNPLIRSSSASLNGHTVRLMAVQDQNDIDSITDEAENAIKNANALISDTDAMTSNSPLKKNIAPPSPPKQQQQQVSSASLSPQAQSQLIAATFSGTVLGAIVSVLIETQLDDISIEPAVVTGIVAIAFGAATYVVAKNPDESNLISKSVRYFLGQPLLSLGDQIKQQITSSIERTTQEIKAIPNKIQQSVEQKVDDTVSTIQSIPSNVQRSIEQQIQQTQNAATQKVQETVSSIQQIPNQVKDAALDYADEIVTEIKATPTRVKDAALDIADEIVTEIKATPEKVQKQAAAFIEETIDDISAIPSKIVASVESAVNSGTTSTTLPQPPKLPPPVSTTPKVAAQQSSPTSFVVPELPKMEFPKIDIPSIPKVELPSIPIVDIPIKRGPPTPTKTVTPKIKKVQQPDAAALAKQRQQEQASAAAARQKAQQQEQAAQAAAKLKAQKEKEQLEQQKLKLQQAKQAAQQRERQLLIQEEAKEERRRLIAEQERQREQEILRKAQEALQRSREAEEKKKKQELERKKQQEEATKKRQQQLAEQQATAQMQKQQSSTVNGASGSFRVAGVPQTRAPRGIPTIVSWKQRKDGGISGRIYGSTNFVDGERIETSVIVTGTIENGYVVKTDSGSRYFLSNEKPITRTVTPDNAGPIQALLSALPGATITLTKTAQEKVSAQKEAAAKKKAENVVVKPRPTFSLFGSSVPSTDVSSTGTTKVTSKVAPRGVPTIQSWRKNRDGSVTGIIYGSSNFSDGEQVTTSPIAIGTLAAGELVRTGSGSKYFLG